MKQSGTIRGGSGPGCVGRRKLTDMPWRAAEKANSLLTSCLLNFSVNNDNRRRWQTRKHYASLRRKQGKQSGKDVLRDGSRHPFEYNG